MAAEKSGKGAGREPSSRWRIELVGLSEQEEFPKYAVYALDRAGKLLEKAKVDEKGHFDLSPKVLDSAHRVILGPESDSLGDVAKERLLPIRAARFKQALEATGVIEVARHDWLKWLLHKHCVRGSVRHCHFFHFEISKFVLQAFERPLAPRLSIKADTKVLSGERESREAARVEATSRRLSADVIAIDDARIARSIYPIPLRHCHPVCDGVVEVYRRTCCCRPWIVFDPRLPELIAELERIIPRIPEEAVPPIKWPPQPGPDPVPYELAEQAGFMKSGALDERIMAAQQDLQALRTLPAEQVADYVNARRYLLCWLKCGEPKKVGQGTINLDGTFHICWLEPIHLHWPFCHDEFAYVVKQNIDGSTVTIYDGLAAGRWFHAADEAQLTSYHPQAQSCRHEDFPEEGAFALLQDIGFAGSWRLKTPASTGWDRVAAPAYNDGLADPVPTAADAVGKYKNRNWGGLLRLRCHFSEPMRLPGVGAKYYRVTVTASDASGNPTGSRTAVAPAAWKYYEVIGSDIFVRSYALGPHSAGGQNNLYEIPYDADRDWQSGHYHALLDTRDFANGRFLVTLEVFDAAGKLLRPTGTADPGGSIEAPFTYRRWYQETGPTDEVPHAALTHMFWWDNRKAVANIVDFRVNGTASTEECQFLVGPGGKKFSTGYRAYHPEGMFLLDHRLWWRRGLGGTTGILTSPHPNPNNVGVPPAAPHESAQESFADMLGSHTKCSFTINLHCNVKTFNGVGTLNGLDDWDQAAVAIEIGTPPSP